MDISNIIELLELAKKDSNDVVAAVQQHNLQKLGIFNNKELSDIMENIKKLELKLKDKTRVAEDFVQYIQYHLEILTFIQEKAVDNPGLRKGPVEWCIVHKIHAAYREAIALFPEDYSMHVPYIRFCIKIDMNDDVLQWCMLFLEKDMTNKKIWRTIEEMYFCEHDPTKSAMWEIMKSFVSLIIPKILSEDDQLPEGGSTRLKKLGDLFNMSFKYIRCSYYHVCLLENIQDVEIMQQLSEEFKQNPFWWNAWAQKLWRVEIKTEPGESSEPFVYRSPRTRLDECIAKYKEGIACALPENKTGLWTMLINFLFYVYESMDNAISNSVKQSLLKTHLTEGMPYFQEDVFVKWLKLVAAEKDLKECLHISERAVALLPESITLWRERLKYEFQKDDTSNARSLFNVAIGHLKEEALLLWEDMIIYILFSVDQECLHELFWEGCKQCFKISHKIRPMFIEWLAIERGIKHARVVYNQLVDTPPHSKEIHVMMSKLECTLEDFNEQEAERIHTIACTQFKDDIEVRLNYMKFLLSLHHRKGANLPERIEVAYNESKAALPPELHEEFKEKYNNMLQASKSSR